MCYEVKDTDHVQRFTFPRGLNPGESVSFPKPKQIITELERRHIVEQIEQALVEIDDSEAYIPQQVVDGLVDALKILGVEYERPDPDSDKE